MARPASVVKELVENSLDAGADQISVEIQSGGKRLIRISDNGTGLSRDEALLAIERYATSKIFTKEDLFSISTFGFRGEALPSIASVSKFVLVTRAEGEVVGTRLEIAGGKLLRVEETGAPQGTMVEVGQLFFNTPARRKFLKGESTEAGHIFDTVSGLAMGNPGVGFRLTANGKLVRLFPKGQDLMGRARILLGPEAAPHLHLLDHQAGPVTVSGVCAGPAVTRSTASRIYYFVNHRLVRDPGLTAALFQGYRGRIMKGRYPMGVVWIGLPFDQVDVNVHPTKREVKFLDPKVVHLALAKGVETAMTLAQADALAYARSATPSAERTRYQIEPDQGFSVAQEPDLWEGREARPPDLAPEKRPLAGDPGKALTGAQRAAGAFSPAAKAQERSALPPRAQDPGQTLVQGSAFRVVGQVMGTYIVAEKEDHLVLVDQHAAHERIAYEALKKRHAGLGIQSQTLMVPEVLELTHGEADILAAILPDLAGMGVKIEPFGETSFVIKSVPVLLEERAVQPFVMEVVEHLSQNKGMGQKDQWLDDCLVSMACHRAIRANQVLNRAEMAQLLADLGKCDNPMHCPHGRPILVTFDQGQLEKLFKRVV